MNIRAWLTSVIIGACVLCAGNSTTWAATNSQTVSELQPRVADARRSLSRAGLAFTKNMGQWPDSILFRSEAAGVVLWFSRSGIHYQLIEPIHESDASDASRISKGLGAGLEGNFGTRRFELIHAEFAGSNPEAKARGEGELPFRSNYFLGNDSVRWTTDVPSYKSIVIENIYPNVTLRCSADDAGRLEYEFAGASEADLNRVHIEYAGAVESMEEVGGVAKVRSRFGVQFDGIAPSGGRRSSAGAIATSLIETVDNTASDDAPGTAQVFMATGLVYSTFLGGTLDQYCYAIALDGNGSAYVTGSTDGSDFPTMNPYQTDTLGQDVFITKLSADGASLIYSTYLGGDSHEAGYGIAIDGLGAAFITGGTASSDFPTLNPFQTEPDPASYDAFVTKLSPAGNSLEYSTYLGGTSAGVQFERGIAIVVDGSGNAYVGGGTNSADFPTLNTIQAYQGGDLDVFVTKLAPSGSTLIYSTLLGGSGFDVVGRNMAVDASGNVYIAGLTSSSDFPTLNPYQTNQPLQDAYLAKISPTGGSLVFSTYLGGSGDDNSSCGVALDGSGSIYVAGTSGSSNFPTLNAYQATNQLGGGDCFLTKFSSAGGSLIYSTFLGGAGQDYVQDLSVESDGTVYLTGATTSSDFPLQSAFQTVYGGNSDAYVSKFNATGSVLEYSTFLGGTLFDQGYGIAIDDSGNAYVAGNTTSPNYPTQGPFQSHGGAQDAFVTKVGAFDDADGDLAEDSGDNCPNAANPGQEDTDGDLVGDACDNCLSIPNLGQADDDLDLVGNACDNCVLISNPLQEDSDLDGIGDVCAYPDSLHIVALASADQSFGFSPVYLVVTDANGDSISPSFNTIVNGSTYDSLGDYDGDTQRDEVVRVEQPVAGPYHIRIEPKTGAEDTAMFTLGIRINGNQFIALDGYENVSVSALGIGVTDTTTITLQDDFDGDGFGLSLDNCPYTYNPDQSDADGDGIGNVCDVQDTLRIAILSDVDQTFESAPAYLVVKDPVGDSISPFFNSIQNGAAYDSLTDRNGDGDRDDQVTIANPISGEYEIRIVPKDGYPDSANFTLIIRIDGNQALAPDDYENASVGALGVTISDVTSYCPTVLTPGNCDGSSPSTTPQAGDIIYLVNHVFKSGLAPNPPEICDVNCDAYLTAADIISLVNYVFKSGPKPCSVSVCSP